MCTLTDKTMMDQGRADFLDSRGTLIFQISKSRALGHRASFVMQPCITAAHTLYMLCYRWSEGT